MPFRGHSACTVVDTAAVSAGHLLLYMLSEIWVPAILGRNASRHAASQTWGTMDQSILAAHRSYPAFKLFMEIIELVKYKFSRRKCR